MSLSALVDFAGTSSISWFGLGAGAQRVSFFHSDTICHQRTLPRATEWSHGEDAGSVSVPVSQFLCPAGGFYLPGSSGSVYSPQGKFANLTRKKMVGALSLPVFWAVTCLLWSSVWFRRRRGIHSSGPPATPQPFLYLIAVTAPNWPSWCLRLRISASLKTVLPWSCVLIAFYVTKER